MVWAAIGTFLLGSVTSSANGEGNWINKLVTLGILAVVLLFIIMVTNVFCYFSPQCTNFWEVLIPDWLEVYLGDIFAITEAEQQQQVNVYNRLAYAGVFGIVAQGLARFNWARRSLTS
jgi:hypothetical protein